eukprot:6260366-Pyramimonas_sp.AAC.1
MLVAPLGVSLARYLWQPSWRGITAVVFRSKRSAGYRSRPCSGRLELSAWGTLWPRGSTAWALEVQVG